MGRSNMTSLKITLLPLAICFLLSLNSQVSGKPSPKYFLIETKEKAKKSSDYMPNIQSINNANKIHTCGNFCRDYVNDINNSGLVGKVVDGSTNVDYVNIISNAPGGA